MLLQSWLGGRHPLGGRHTNSGNRRTLRHRPLVERLEDRLPPGDAVVAGWLVGALMERAAGFIPAEPLAAPPGQARRLAEPQALAAETGDFTLLAGIAAPAAACVRALEQTPTTGEPGRVSAGSASLGALTQPRSPIHPPKPATVGVALSAPLAGGFTGLAASTMFAPVPVTNHELDQAAAAMGLVHEDGDRETGGEVQSSGVRALFDLSQPQTGPFPANVFTVPDRSHNTGRRVNLPFPDCQVHVSDCMDLAVLNELDGFNLQPRLSIPFSGPIDVDSVSSSTVFLISLGSTLPHGGDPRGTAVGINQTVWDVATNTLHVESDALLAQHTRYALIVTNGVRDADGDPVEASPEFRRFRQTAPREYRRELLDAVREAQRLGVRERDIVTASVFTTQSATAVLEKIRDQIKAGTPEPADFLLGPGGSRTVFPFEQVTGITWCQQTEVNPPMCPPFVNLNLALLRDIYPGAVEELAFGKYVSPDYEVHPGEYIPPVGTRTGTPEVRGVNEIYFNLVLPSGSKSPSGWPVAIFGQGLGGNKQGAAPRTGAAAMADRGIATLTINAVGHGFGPLGTLTVNQAGGGPVTFSAGGRGIDQDGNNTIGNTEGFNAARPRAIIDDRDGMRQTAADLLQLVRVVEVGMDLDGDGSRDVDPSRTYYVGQSRGGDYGMLLLAVEPDVRAGVANVPGGPRVQIGRLGLDRRPIVGGQLGARMPPLLNSPGISELVGVTVGRPYFHENLPLRDGVPLVVRLEEGTGHTIQSPVINTVPGAMAIQEVIENTEWVQHSGDSVAYAPHLRKDPLAGVPAKSVIVQFAKGDQTVPNPMATALLRAGDLADRATLYRHDLALAEFPLLPNNPHLFLSSITNATWRPIVLGTQRQIAAFFASDGTKIICPEPAQFFECPIQGPLPEDLNFIP